MTWPHLNYLAVIVAAVGATVLSGAWYGLFGSTMAKLSDAYAGPQSPQPAQLLTVVLRSLVVAVVLAWLVDAAHIAEWGAALELAVIAWIGFPVMILAGSVIHEKVPAKLAAIHAGDWLVKLIAITLVVALWR